MREAGFKNIEILDEKPYLEIDNNRRTKTKPGDDEEEEEK